MIDIFLKSSLAIIKLSTSDNQIKNLVDDDFLFAYIPSVEILVQKPTKKVDATISFLKCNFNKIDFEYPTINCYYKKFDSKDIISLIEYVFERARQEKGIICIHGASAVIKNKAVICWGPATGMGKTTLAVCLSKKNNIFYSDEKVLINLKTFKTAGRIKKQYLSNEFWKNIYGDFQFYEHKNINQKLDYEIGLFVYSLITESKYYKLDIWQPSKFFWHLYEEASRKIRGTSRLFFNFSYSPPSLDTETLAKKRIILIKKFTKIIKSLYFKGNINSALSTINNYL